MSSDIIPGDWLQFNNLSRKHFFERFGEVLDDKSICKRASMYSGPLVKAKSAHLCPACVKILRLRQLLRTKIHRRNELGEEMHSLMIQIANYEEGIKALEGKAK